MPFVRLGLFLWVVFRAALLFARINTKFQGESHRFEAGEARFDVDRDKHDNPQQIRLGVQVADTFQFVLRRERTLDRAGKWLGIVQECQTGDRTFDERVFVLSDDPAVARLLTTRPGARESVGDLLRDTRVRELRCNAGTLWITANPSGMAKTRSDVQLAENLAEQHLPRLLALRKLLQQAASADRTQTRDPRQRIETACYVGCVAVLIAGVFAWLWSQGTGLPRPLAFGNVETKTLGVTLALTAIAAAVVWWLLDRSSRLHLVLLELVLSFAPGTWLATRTAAIEYNIRADATPPALQSMRVVDSYRVRGRRSTSYYIVVDRWPFDGLEKKIRVPSSVYQRFRPGECVTVDVRPGRLGDPWLKSMRESTCSSDAF
jgi:hypothetical protein